MKLLVDLLSISRIDEYNVDGYIASCAYLSCHNGRCFSYDELKVLSEIKKNKNKILIVNIDRIIEEDEIEEVYNYIDTLISLDIDYFIYGDFSILRYFIKKNLSNKLIYDPKTLITNFYDADFHNQYNSLVSINNELTLAEIKEVAKAKNAMMEVYGFHQMFYSRRALLSNYGKFKEIDNNFIDDQYIIKEENRDYSYPIYESKNGTFIYTPYIYCLFKELQELNDLRFIRVNSIFLEESKVIEVVKLYKELLEDFSKADILYDKLLEIDDRIDSGFLYKKTVVLKEEIG